MGHRVTTLNVNTIEPAGSTLTLGASGDTIVATDSVNVNTLKDMGDAGTVVSAFTTVGAGTWTCPAGVTSAEVLVVAGGGGGGGSDTGGQSGGGGGAGGVVHHATYTVVPAVVYDITVGDSGLAGTNSGAGRNAGNGGNSVCNVNAEGSQSAMTAVGGGGGSEGAGIAGGSAGGTGRGNATAASGSQGDSGGGTGYGNDGGYDGNNATSAGGGGAGAVGGNGATYPGPGGAGREFSNFSDYGVAGFFAGGGGGGSGDSDAGGAGGSGGGGAGGSEVVGNDATANTGGGAGGGGAATGGGTGGSGVVLVRYNVTEAQSIFQSDGSGNLSNVNSGFGGPLVLLGTQTASDSASLAFTSGLTSTYNTYLFRFNNIVAATDGAYFTFQTSTDGGSNYTVTITSSFFEAYNKEDDTSYGLTDVDANMQGQGNLYQYLNDALEGVSQHADATLDGELHLFDVSSTTYIKNFYTRTNAMVQLGASAPGSVDAYVGGYFNTTSAIDAISFKMSSGNITVGTIKMYGIK